MQAHEQELSAKVLDAGFAWIRTHAMGQAEQFALLYLAMGWTWQNSPTPPSPLEIRNLILRLADDLHQSLKEESAKSRPYAVSSRSGGIEIGIRRDAETGTPEAYIYFRTGESEPLDEHPADSPTS